MELFCELFRDNGGSPDVLSRLKNECLKADEFYAPGAVYSEQNISAYLGSASYMEMYESRIPEGFMEKKPELGGVSAVRITI